MIRRRRHRDPDPGVEQAQAIRDESRDMLRWANAIGDHNEAVEARNHFAEAIERTMRRRFAT